MKVTSPFLARLHLGTNPHLLCTFTSSLSYFTYLINPHLPLTPMPFHNAHRSILFLIFFTLHNPKTSQLTGLILIKAKKKQGNVIKNANLATVNGNLGCCFLSLFGASSLLSFLSTHSFPILHSSQLQHHAITCTELDRRHGLLDARSVQMCRDYFDALDIKGNGELDDVVFSAWLGAVTDLSQKQIYKLFDMVDGDDSGSIDFDEMYLLICALIAIKDGNEKQFLFMHSRTCFSLLDVDGDASITLSEFINFGFLFGFTGRAAKAIFSEFDVEGDRELSFEEFRIFTLACIDKQADLDRQRAAKEAKKLTKGERRSRFPFRPKRRLAVPIIKEDDSSLPQGPPDPSLTVNERLPSSPPNNMDSSITSRNSVPDDMQSTRSVFSNSLGSSMPASINSLPQGGRKLTPRKSVTSTSPMGGVVAVGDGEISVERFTTIPSVRGQQANNGCILM